MIVHKPPSLPPSDITCDGKAGRASILQHECMWECRDPAFDTPWRNVASDRGCAASRSDRRQASVQPVQNELVCAARNVDRSRHRCESTARDAEMPGYRVVFIMHATAALSDEQHTASLMSMASIFADVRSTADSVELHRTAITSWRCLMRLGDGAGLHPTERIH